MISTQQAYPCCASLSPSSLSSFLMHFFLLVSCHFSIPEPFWMQDWGMSEAATRRAERPQANDWFRFLHRPHEYFDYRSAKKR